MYIVCIISLIIHNDWNYFIHIYIYKCTVWAGFTNADQSQLVDSTKQQTQLVSQRPIKLTDVSETGPIYM